MCKRRLNNLLKTDRVCYWCNKPVYKRNYSNGKRTKKDEATVDHIFSKNDIRKYILYFLFDGKIHNTVLSCASCNYKRNKRELKKIQNSFVWKMNKFFATKIRQYVIT